MNPLASNPASYLTAPALGREPVGRALLVNVAVAVGLAGLLMAVGLSSIAAVWLVFCAVDAQPLIAAPVLRTTQNFALAWVGAALLRLPAGLVLANWFRFDQSATDALPFVYLASLLLSAVLAAMVIRRSQPDTEASVRGR